MLGTLLSAFVCGLFAGLAPGPYTTIVAASALERGFRAGARLALIPLVSDIPPLVVCALVLEALDPRAFAWVGMLGGVVLIGIGLRFYRRHSAPDPGLIPEHAPPSAPFLQVALGTILSPAPWLFWGVVAGPLMLRALHRGPQEGAAYVIVLFATNIGSATALAWAASHGSRVLSARWQRRMLSVVGVGLMGAGALLLWQGWRGDLDELIAGQRLLRGAVEEGAERLQD